MHLYERKWLEPDLLNQKQYDSITAQTYLNHNIFATPKQHDITASKTDLSHNISQSKVMYDEAYVTKNVDQECSWKHLENSQTKVIYDKLCNNMDDAITTHLSSQRNVWPRMCDQECVMKISLKQLRHITRNVWPRMRDESILKTIAKHHSCCEAMGVCMCRVLK